MTTAKPATTLGAVPDASEAAPPKQQLDWRILVGCVLAGVAIGMALGAKLAPPRVVEHTLPAEPCQVCAERKKADEVTTGSGETEEGAASDG